MTKIPDSIWAPIMGGVLLLIVGTIGLIVGQPWFFSKLWTNNIPSGSKSPLSGARFYNTIVGHYAGIVAGLIEISIFSLWLLNQL